MKEEDYKDYCNQQWEIIIQLQDSYKKKPSKLNLFFLWQLYRELKADIPEWVMVGLDQYIESGIKYECSRRGKSGHKMSALEYVRIKSAKDPAAAKRKYADREGITVNAVEKRMIKSKLKPEKK